MKKLIYLLSIIVLASCEKAVAESNDGEENVKSKGNVTLCFTPYDVQNFTRGTMGDAFTRLNLMLFTSNRDKVFDKIKTQNSDDENFGTISFNAAAGTYTIVAIGHSGAKSVTIDSPEKVSFTATDGVKITDTFYYYGTIDVTDNPQTYNLVMNRGVGMFRLILTDTNIPETVSKFKFSFAGTVGMFNPSTGTGCNTTSKQEETRNTTTDNTYSIYTFPKGATSCTATITVQALDNTDALLQTKVFEDVPISVNKITQYKGEFFTGSSTVTATSMGFTVNAEWGDVNEHTF